MIAFRPAGPLLGFTAAASAPTSVQAISLDGVQQQQVVITNTDTTNDAVVGWGISDAVAKLNAAAAASVQNCTYVLHASQIVVTVPSNSYFSGITGSSTAVVKVQAGYGN